MKPSNSKSLLVTNRTKDAAEKNESGCYTTKRQKSQSQLVNRSRNNKSKTIIYNKQEEGSDIKNIKCQQLFCVIQTFYNTLASLPLQSLINSSEPQFWIKEQQQTLKELQKKLEKFNKNKDHEYYKWKLNSVEKILGNITQNMTMLQRMNHLKGYYSGSETSNYRSRGSSSIESEQSSLKLGNFATTREEAKEMLSYDHYVINQNRPAKSIITNQSPQLLAQTVNSDEEFSSQEDEDNKLMARSQMFQKQQRARRRTLVEGTENINTINLDNKYKNNQFVKNKTKQLDLKDKTLTKVAGSKKNHYNKTLTNRTNEEQYGEEQIKNCAKYYHILRKQIQKNVQNTIEYTKEECTEQSQTITKDIQKEQYVTMIKELRLQLLNKDKEIQKLLINEQDYQSGIQMCRQRQKQQNTQILFLKQNISNTNREKEKYQNQIRKLIQYQQQLKQTIRFERDRNKREEKEKEKIEQKFYQQINSKDDLLNQISQLKQDNRSILRNERIMKEKLQVYTKKYFKVYKELQHSKQIEKLLIQELEEIKNKRCNTQSRYDKIKEMMEFQKERLFDESF